MIDIQTGVQLAPYTSFYIGGPAAFFCEAENILELQEALEVAREHDLPVLVLGGGSNVLISDEGFSGLVIRLINRGITASGEAENDHVKLMRVGSGELWDDVVRYAATNNLWGIENLSHIPGYCGAFAVQNVGAYGQEAADVVVSVEVYDTENGIVKTLSNEQCEFTYRHSIFNTSSKGRYIILHTTIRLSTVPAPQLGYGDVRKYFADLQIAEPSLTEIRQAIISIRNRKFPFPNKPESGNAGSFFRGPIIDKEHQNELFEKVKNNFGAGAVEKLESMKDRLMVSQGMKMPTAFLIELCNLKGWRIGGAEVNPDQAAIILNATGIATANDVMDLFKHVRTVVFQKTGIELHAEPELLGFSPQQLAAAFAIMV